MKNKSADFMSLLESYFTEYMPYAAGLSENTILSYKYTFRLLLNYLIQEKGIRAEKVSFQCLDYDAIAGFLDWLENDRGCTVSTRNQRLAALSAFAVYAGNRNMDAASVFMTSVKRIPAKRTMEKPRTVFTIEEVALLLRLPDMKTTIGKRDHAILNLMYASGARSQEICDLRVRDVIFQKETTRLILTGKGNKARRIIIATPCADILKRYLEWRNISRELDHYVFSSQTHEHMTLSCVEEIYKKYIRRAKELYPDKFREPRYTPHTMRHTCATHMLEAGVPIMAIKNFLGHSSVMTTERYAALSQATVNSHIREWNNKWFHDAHPANASATAKDPMPDFLR